MEAAKAAVATAGASLEQSRADLEWAKTELARTIIKSPVKGVVLDRRVNVGQYVSPEKSPSLFLIAKDLKKLQIWASVNEADIGRIYKGMAADFTVDGIEAAKGTVPFSLRENRDSPQTFKGKVAEIRLNAALTQNIVTYTVVITIEKPDPRLLPYMTANLRFQVESQHDVLRVPNAALRWKPRPEQTLPATPTGPSADTTNPFVPQLRGVLPTLYVIDPDGKRVRPLSVQAGLTDGAVTEVSGPGVKEGLEVVVGER